MVVTLVWAELIIGYGGVGACPVAASVFYLVVFQELIIGFALLRIPPPV